jgi:hypothetical protein
MAAAASLAIRFKNQAIRQRIEKAARPGAQQE